MCAGRLCAAPGGHDIGQRPTQPRDQETQVSQPPVPESPSEAEQDTCAWGTGPWWRLEPGGRGARVLSKERGPNPFWFCQKTKNEDLSSQMTPVWDDVMRRDSEEVAAEVRIEDTGRAGDSKLIRTARVA